MEDKKLATVASNTLLAENMKAKRRADVAAQLEAMEKERQKNFAKASEDWANLTDKDEWPDEEHEQRFDAAIRKILFSKPIK